MPLRRICLSSLLAFALGCSDDPEQPAPGPTDASTDTGTSQSPDLSVPDLGAAELEWTAPETRRYWLSTDGSSAEVNLAVYERCGGGELACARGTPANVKPSASLELSATAGTSYLIVVDFQYDSTVGPFELSILPL